LRSALTIAFASSVLVLLPLRVLLAIGGLATWTTAWQTIERITFPLVEPFALLTPLNREVIGNATLAEIAALGVFSVAAVYFLALLTVRRQR
jgi:hypothetical protein